MKGEGRFRIFFGLLDITAKIDHPSSPMYCSGDSEYFQLIIWQGAVAA